MLFYDKRVVYLSYLEDNTKIKSAGYIRIEIKNQLFTMDMHIDVKDMPESGKYEIVAEGNGEAVPMGAIYLQNGKGSYQESFPAGEVGKGDYFFAYENIETFRILLKEGTCISGSLPFTGSKGKPVMRAAVPVQDVQRENKQEISASAENHRTFAQTHHEYSHDEDVRKKLEEVRLTPDKWQQLLKSYKQIHPYGDERLYISLEPRDFVIMSEEYQHLAHNSFLLHGFYNYRHIILGAEEDGFYLGVPGVFYEREKMVAMMFGFEAFECEGGKAENGKFGYYLKKIKI